MRITGTHARLLVGFRRYCEGVTAPAPLGMVLKTGIRWMPARKIRAVNAARGSDPCAAAFLTGAPIDVAMTAMEPIFAMSLYSGE